MLQPWSLPACLALSHEKVYSPNLPGDWVTGCALAGPVVNCSQTDWKTWPAFPGRPGKEQPQGPAASFPKLAASQGVLTVTAAPVPPRHLWRWCPAPQPPAGLRSKLLPPRSPPGPPPGGGGAPEGSRPPPLSPFWRCVLRSSPARQGPSVKHQRSGRERAGRGWWQRGKGGTEHARHGRRVARPRSPQCAPRGFCVGSSRTLEHFSSRSGCF